MIDEGLPLNGTYLRIVLEVNPEIMQDNQEKLQVGKALILSTLFPHEVKLSVMHFKIRRQYDNKEVIESKEEVEIHCGFRRMTIKPIYGLETSAGHSERLRFMRFLRHDMSVIASAYCPIVFAPCKVLMFKKNEEG